MPLSLSAIEGAISESWSTETRLVADDFIEDADRPSRGQCSTTALVVLELLGGELLIAPVFKSGEPSGGHHYWCRLPSGVEIDLTADQWHDDETVGEPRVVTIPASGIRRGIPQYLLLRTRVHARLGLSLGPSPWAGDGQTGG